jgi:hypothetical protein
MDLPRRYPYDPQWRLVLFTLAAGAPLVALGTMRRPSLQVALVLESPFIVLAVLLALRRLVFRRFIELQPDAMLLPTGFLNVCTTRIPYAEIADVLSNSSVLWIETEKGVHWIRTLWLPELGSFSALRGFLLTYSRQDSSKLLGAEAEQLHNPLGLPQKFVGCLVEMAAMYIWLGMLYGSLFFAAGGHGLVFAGLLPHRSPWSVVLITFLMMPLLIVFTLTYFNRSPFSPRVYCILLLVAVGWYVTETLLAEGLIYYGALPSDTPRHVPIVAHILMHAGWLSLIPITLLYRSARAYILESAA